MVNGGEERRRRMLAWTAFAAGLCLYVAFQVIPLLQGSSQNDFKHVWLGAMLMAEGQSPYPAGLMRETAAVFASEDPRFRSILPYVYLPFTSIVLRPLTWMDFDAAQKLWQVINHVLLVGGLFLAARAAGCRWEWKTPALLFAAVAFNYTVFRQTNAGQLNNVLVFGSALLFWSLMRGKHAALSGFIAAFLMLFKLTPGIFLIWFLLSRRWHEAGWTCGWAAVLLLLSLPFAGLRTYLDFLPVLADMGYGKSTWAELGQTFWRDPYNMSPNAFFHRALVDWPGAANWLSLSPALANAATWVVTLLLLAGLSFAVLRAPKSAGTAGKTALSMPEQAGFALAVLVSLLAPGILWDHYLVQALLPAVILWQVAQKLPRPGLWRGMIVASVVIFSLGVEFGALFLHPGVFSAYGLRVEIPLPGREGPIAVLWGSLKLLPVLLLSGLAFAVATNREKAESGAHSNS